MLSSLSRNKTIQITVIMVCLIASPSYLNASCKKVVTQSNCFDVFVSVGHKYQKYIIKTPINLSGKTIELPRDITIEFGKKGMLYNGQVRGNNTKLKKLHSNCLGIICLGSWNMPVIKDSFFDQNYLSDTQIIDNITNIQSDDILNFIYLYKPQYNIELSSKHKRALCLSSNSKLFIQSKLCVNGNNLPQYAVISVGNKKNVVISGGEIEGDVGKHIYTDDSSQWGFGIQLSWSENVLISDITIRKCIGDGIYVGGGEGTYYGDYSEASKNIEIKRVVSDDNRRQGISITYACDVLLEDCIFSNTGKTEFVSPGCGLDIEPNLKQSVGNVIIRRCEFLHNDRIFDVSVGGYRVEKDKCNVENILFEDCNVTGILSIRTGSATLRNCTMATFAIHLGEMPKEKVLVEDCKIVGGDGITIRTSCTVTRDQNLPIYEFKNCQVSVDQIKTKAIISTISHKGNERGRLIFSNCVFSMPSNPAKYDFIQAGCVYSFTFSDCDINTGGRVLNNRGLSFFRCKLNCQYVDLAPTKESCILEDCIICSSDPQKSIVFSPSTATSQYIVRGCRIADEPRMPIVSRGVKTSRYVVSDNQFSNKVYNIN